MLFKLWQMFFSFKFEPIFAGSAQSVLDEFAPFKVLSLRLTTENSFLFTAVVKSINKPSTDCKGKSCGNLYTINKLLSENFANGLLIAMNFSFL
jgi:hypothetical protein